MTEATGTDTILSSKLQFNLTFTKSYDFGLNFANVLKNSLANVSTNGYINVSANAGISFVLKIDFSRENLDEDTKLSNVGIEKNKDVDGKKIDITKDSYYATFEVQNKRSFDHDLYVKLVNSEVSSESENSTLGTIKINANAEIGSTETWNDVTDSDPYSIGFTSDNCLYVTAKQKFDIEKGYSDDESASSGCQKDLWQLVVMHLQN